MITIKPEHFYIFTCNVIEELNGKKHDILFSNNIKTMKKKGYEWKYKPYCVQTYIGYNNHHYSTKEFGIYLLHETLTNPSFPQNPKEWDTNAIVKTNVLYSPKILKKDIETIESVQEKLKLKDKSKFGEIDSEGESIFYKWMKSNIISPITLLRFKNILQSENESNEHKDMRIILDMMEKVYTQRTIK